MSHNQGVGDIKVAFQLERESALLECRHDDWRTTSLIFADWLEDHEDQALAEAIRIDVARADEKHPPRASAWPDVSQFPDLTDHQREQLARATARPFGVLCGGPGTGKTHTAATLAHALPAQHLAVAAPTGKAAVRMAEALRAVRPGTTIAPSTIHQLLGIDRAGYDGGGWGFRHDASNPLPHRYILIDEPSMLPLDLADDLFRAIRPGTHVLAVGDPDQLPPVGHGAVLRDWINCGAVPVGRLTEIHRNGGAIAQACRAIREGMQDQAIEYATSAELNQYILSDGKPDANWRHLEASSASLAAEQLRGLLGTVRDFSSEEGLHPNIQIIAPVREKGPLSCAAVNRMCQEILNPHGEEVKAWGTKVRQRDRIICTRNHWATVATNTMRTHYVANGESGVVTSVGQRMEGVFNATDVRLSRGEDDNFALGYCITGHKSQGSEWPVTIVMLDGWGGRNVMGREWVYTVLSRARRLCITIGRLWSIRQAVAEQRLEVRRTFLDTRIREGVALGKIA